MDREERLRARYNQNYSVSAGLEGVGMGHSG